MESMRRHQRYEFQRVLTVSWMSTDGRTSCVGHCFEASARGLSAEAPRYIPVGTKVTIYLDGFEETIEATVRHCRKIRFWYRIGFHLAAPLSLAIREKWIVAHADAISNAHHQPASWQTPTRSSPRP